VIERTPEPTPEPEPQPVVKRPEDMTHQELLEHVLQQQVCSSPSALLILIALTVVKTLLRIKREDHGTQFRTNAEGDDDDVEFISLRPTKRVRVTPTDTDIVVDLTID